MKFPFCVCLSPLVFALFHPALAEGNNGSLDFEQRINGKAVLKTIEPIRERLQDLSAVFFSGHDVVIYGIVLSPDGYIATKASELHSYRDLTIRVGSSKYGQFREIGSDPSTDIAVVKVEAAGLHAPGPVSNDAAMGTLVVSNGSTTRTSRRPQLGTLSAEQRPIPNGDTAYLGVVFGTPCTIQEVTKDGPADQAGAQAGDEILAVDGTPVTALDAVSPILSRKKVGERVTLKVKRKDKRLSYTITLGSRRQALGGNAPEDSNDLIDHREIIPAFAEPAADRSSLYFCRVQVRLSRPFPVSPLRMRFLMYLATSFCLMSGVGASRMTCLPIARSSEINARREFE